jgi:hypothetical protein
VQTCFQIPKAAADGTSPERLPASLDEIWVLKRMFMENYFSIEEEILE